MVAVERMTSVELARSMAVSASSYAWLLGAGASAAGGIPTAHDMTLDFKSRLFCSARGIPRRDIDLADPSWRQRITFYDDDGRLPPTGDPDEYAAAFEAAFPDEADRRRYIAVHVQRGQATFGHRLLAAMIASRQIRCLFTTNFDQLTERSAVFANELLPVEQRTHPTVATLDTADVARRCLNDGDWPLFVKLHGDYQSTRLKNVRAELQAQNEDLRGVLVDAVKRFGLVVVGFSGRDKSVMEALQEPLEGSSRFPAGIRWVVRPGHDPMETVSAFLNIARSAGVDARLVEARNFDELAADIDRQIDLPDPLAAYVLDAADAQSAPRTVLVEREDTSTSPADRVLDLSFGEVAVQKLPKGCQERIELLRRASPSGADRLVGILSDPSSRTPGGLRQLTDNPPPWLIEAGAVSWEAISDFMDAHNLAGSDSARRMAIKAGSPRSSLYRIAEAVETAEKGDPGRAEALLTEVPPEYPLLSAAQAFIAGEMPSVVGAIETGRLHRSEDPDLAIYSMLTLVKAYLCLDNFNLATEVLRAANEQFPDRPMLLLHQAHSTLGMAQQAGLESSGWHDLLSEAVELALRSRDCFRQWGRTGTPSGGPRNPRATCSR